MDVFDHYWQISLAPLDLLNDDVVALGIVPRFSMELPQNLVFWVPLGDVAEVLLFAVGVEPI